jgi:hypothetical protein
VGCDIHGFIDYDKIIAQNLTHNTHTSNFAKLRISRNYWLFTLLSCVRGEAIQGQEGMPAKGLPKSLSYTVRDEAYVTVCDDELPLYDDGFCTRKDAERWGGNYVDEEKRFIHHPDWHSHSWLSLDEVKEVIRRYSLLKERNTLWLKEGDPLPEGYKLQSEEIDEEIQVASRAGLQVAYRDGPSQVPMELLAIRSIMETITERGMTPRFVFWYDN